MDREDLWVLLFWNEKALLYDLVFVLAVIPAFVEGTEAEGISCIYFKDEGNILPSLLDGGSTPLASMQVICACESSHYLKPCGQF